MARIHGRHGRLYAGLAGTSAEAEEVAFLKGWEITFETDDTDVTAFGDLNKVTLAGLPDSSGTFDGFYDTATDQLYTAATDGGSRRFYLYADTPATTADYWFGSATFDFSVAAAVDDAVKVSGGFAATSNVSKAN